MVTTNNTLSMPCQCRGHGVMTYRCRYWPGELPSSHEPVYGQDPSCEDGLLSGPTSVPMTLHTTIFVGCM